MPCWTPQNEKAPLSEKMLKSWCCDCNSSHFSKWVNIKLPRIYTSLMALGTGREDALWADVLYFTIRANKSIGQIETAIELYDHVIGFDSLTVLLKSELMWQMGLIHFEQDRPDIAERLLLEALEITEQNDLRESQMKLFNALARVQIATRRVEMGIET